MTPCINVAKKAAIAHRIHEYRHDPTVQSYGLEAAEMLGVAQERVFKTLVVALDAGTLAVGVLPVSAMLSMKQLAKAAGVKKAEMADKPTAERATGYVLGGISPLGQKKRLKTFIDGSAAGHATIFVSAGRRGLEIELSPHDLKRLTGGIFADISQ